MGTNFYWIKLPKELKKFEKQFKKECKDTNVLYHIGKRSASGNYCYECGTTFCIHGTSKIHYDENPYPLFSDAYKEAQKYYWYEKCPICGSEGKYITSFTWTFMKQKEIIQALELRNCNDVIIKDEYDTKFTAREFLHAVETPVEYQMATAFG